MTIVYAVAVIVLGALTALWMIQRHARLLQQAEYRAKERELQSAETKELFNAEARKAERQTQVLGEAEAEVAKKQRLIEERKVEQVRLAKQTLSMLDSYSGSRMLQAHNLTVDGLLAAVARQLDDLPPDPQAIEAANNLARQKALGEKQEDAA